MSQALWFRRLVMLVSTCTEPVTAQAVAGVAIARVRRVLAIADVARRDPFRESGPGDPEQRACHPAVRRPLRNAPQTIRPTAAQQPQQDRLGLVVGRVGGHDDVRPRASRHPS